MQKLKTFREDEFEIVGFNEGNGTDDHAGMLKYVEALAKVEVKK